MAREGPATVIRRVLDHVRRATPYSCWSLDEIPREVKAEVEEKLKERFELWANSWVVPELENLLKKLDKKKKGGSHA